MQSQEKFLKDVYMPLTQRTAQILQKKQIELAKIKWTDGESNTDSEFSRLACDSCEEAWNDIKEGYPDFKDLPLEFQIPDINIILSKDGKPLAVGKIELKSSKGNGIIPGSTIGKLDINQPVIFCLRDESAGTFEFRYSQYHNCIGESNTDTFQDRKPRPHVNFQKMTDINSNHVYIYKEKGNWVEHYAKCALLRTKEHKRYKSWQDTLTARIIELFIKETSIEDFAKRKLELL